MLTDNELDLEKLFLPAWAQEAPAAQRYAKFTGNEGEPRRREGRYEGGDRPRRREGGGESQFRGRGDDRPRGQRPGPRRDFARRDERPEPPPQLPEVNVALLPEERGAESLARQIKSTGRAFPLFGIAHLVLQKPDRYAITISVRKKADGQIAQPLFLCALDDSLWLSEDEAVAHVLKQHFATFYQTERTPTDPPKGVYTFVAQCGMSGAILGPPNIHDYQNKLRKLHAERFSRMPFEAFKARVRIVKDEVVVKKWIEEQSFKTEYAVLNVPEPLKLASMEEVEKHFRSIHKDNIIKPVESHTLGGVAARSLRCRELARAIRFLTEEQQRFPLQIATALSQRFATQGLHFFKVNKTVTHVSVARPLFLDLEATPVSENIKRIVEFINAHPKCTRRKLFEALAPAPPTPIVPAGATTEAPAAVLQAEPTPEQNAVNGDLHWLIHQGHVIEFADGRLETAKKPAPRPQKQEKKPAVAQPVAEGEPVASTTTVPANSIIEPTTETPVVTEAAVPIPSTAVETITDVVPAEPAATESAMEEGKSAKESCPVCGKIFKKWELPAHKALCQFQVDGPQMPKPRRPDDDDAIKKVMRSETAERIAGTRSAQQ